MTYTSPVPLGAHPNQDDELSPLLTPMIVRRWPAARSFVVVGSLCVVAGGLVAAVTGPTDFEPGSWLAAYLVLVGGVAQIASGAGQAWLSADQPPTRLVRAEVIGWNLALLAVVVGTLSSFPVATTIGGVITAAVLVAFLLGTRHARRQVGGAALLYRALVIFVLLSAPVGILLAWVRHG